MFFEPNISLHKICFKGFGKEGIKLKICLSIQNNFICALTLNSLFGDLYIINRKIKIEILPCRFIIRKYRRKLTCSECEVRFYKIRI